MSINSSDQVSVNITISLFTNIEFNSLVFNLLLLLVTNPCTLSRDGLISIFSRTSYASGSFRVVDFVVCCFVDVDGFPLESQPCEFLVHVLVREKQLLIVALSTITGLQTLALALMI